MDEIKIEKGIPLPFSTKGVKNGISGVISRMEIKDSIFLPSVKLVSIRGSVSWVEIKSAGAKKFACRTVEGGVRIWRIK